VADRALTIFRLTARLVVEAEGEAERLPAVGGVDLLSAGISVELN